jgi:hypothetical protein
MKKEGDLERPKNDSEKLEINKDIAQKVIRP